MSERKQHFSSGLTPTEIPGVEKLFQQARETLVDSIFLSSTLQKTYIWVNDSSQAMVPFSHPQLPLSRESLAMQLVKSTVSHFPTTLCWERATLDNSATKWQLRSLTWKAYSRPAQQLPPLCQGQSLVAGDGQLGGSTCSLSHIHRSHSLSRILLEHSVRDKFYLQLLLHRATVLSCKGGGGECVRGASFKDW